MDFALTFPGITGTIAPPSGVPTGGLFTTGQDAIRAGLSFFLIIVLLLALLYAALGAMRYIFSRGDKQKIQGAREKITYAIVGLIVAFLAFLLVGLFSSFVNAPLISTTSRPTLAPCLGYCVDDAIGCSLGETEISRTTCESTPDELCCVAAPTPIPTLTVTVTAAPVSSPSPLNSFISFDLEGTATGVWTASLYCEGVFGGTITGSSSRETFSTPCTFTTVRQHDANVDVTRSGITVTGTVIVTVSAGPTATPTPTGAPTPTPTPTAALTPTSTPTPTILLSPTPTPTLIPNCAVDTNLNTLCLSTTCSSLSSCASTSLCTCSSGFFACVATSALGCIAPPPTPTATPIPTSTPAPTPTPISFAIGGVVWVDLNENGAINSGEPGFNGAWLNLANVTNSINSDIQSSSTGNYSFNVPEGDYTLTLTPVIGYRVTTGPGLALGIRVPPPQPNILFGLAPIVSGTIVINNLNDSSTSSPSVMLTLSCSVVAPFSCAEMRISNTPAGISIAATEVFVEQTTWDLLPGAGTKAVFVQFRVLGGNWSNVFADTIELVVL